MAVKDKDYLFGKSTRRVPTEAEIADMVMTIIPWSKPMSENTNEAFSELAMQGLIAPVKKTEAAPVHSASQKVNIPLNGKLPAGYTYWGQWIAHDIVAPTHPHQNHYSSRVVSPALNLDSLYGCEEGLPPHLLFNEQGFFRLAENGWDCLRDGTGSPMLPEPRNNDNAIILQFHVQLQRIHNAILSMLSGSQPLPHLCENPDTFYLARYYTTLLFHHLVKKEWLHALLDKQVYRYYFGDTEPEQTLLDATVALARVPYEFSHAAFRFGHSMVRETYKLRDNMSFDLRALLTHQPFKGNAIPAIDWSLFFGEFAQEVQPINLIIVNGMGAVPINRNIAERNIQAGIKAAIPTVHESKVYLQEHFPRLFEHVGMSPVETQALLDDLKIDPMNQTSSFCSLFDEGCLPLWPYILSESAVQTDNPGHRLGKLGSVIVADVLRHSMQQGTAHTPEHIVKQADFNRFLDTFCAHIGVKSKDVLTMANLLCEKE